MPATVDHPLDLTAPLADEQDCIDRLRSIRWGDGDLCPYCDDRRIYHFSDRRTFKCGGCRRRFSIKVGTIFEDTKLPLGKWFIAIRLITNRSKGMTSTALARNLRITQKSAWLVLRRLRHAARTPSFNAPLEPAVERDTTPVGSKRKPDAERVGGTPNATERPMVVTGGDVTASSRRRTNPRGRTLEPKLSLDMPFDDALRRFVRTKPHEVGHTVER